MFLGRHVVEQALVRGHDVTLFNRGRHNHELFPDVEKLRGDRDGDLGALEGRRWDAVVDPSGYVPRVVRASAELLARTVDHYTFVSSISVYADFSSPGFDESAPVATLEDEATENVEASYGALKALCERAVDEEMGGRSLSVRAGLIVGPHDPTGRFTYWVRRVAEGGEVLAPEPRDQPVQLVDARDLAAWIVEMAEGRRTGVYNATGPAEPLRFDVLLEECRAATGSDARLVWVDERFLVEQGVEPWDELPLWLAPETHPEVRGFLAAGAARAIAAGLAFRPLVTTILDTLAWDAKERATAAVACDYGVLPKPAGLSRKRERVLLDAWRRRAGT